MTLGSVRLTTPLRTAMDLGARLSRSRALAALDWFMRQHGITRDDMVAAGYSEARRAMAKQIGLGRKPAPAAAPEDTSAAAPDAPKRARRKKADA